MGGEFPAAELEVGISRLAERQRLDRHREAVVPVLVEAVRQLRDHGAADNEVEVAELDGRARLEVLVADVAPAGDRHRVVADQQLVVHPVVEAPALEQEFSAAQEREMAPRDVRIVDADLDVGMRGERSDHRAGVEGLCVVQKQPHAHAAVRGLQQRFEQQLPGVVLLQDEVLDVECPLGTRGDAHPHREAVLAVDEQPESG